MINKKKMIFFMFIIVSGFVYYFISVPYFNDNYIYRDVFVSRVIDGDTFEIEGGEKVRMLGINTPEKNMEHYSEASAFLKQKIENKEIELISIFGNEKDKYGRTLGYVILDNSLVNSEIIGEGLANVYFYEKDSYILELLKAREKAIKNGKGIWKKSSLSCLEFVELDYFENEKLILNNLCNKELEVVIKDSANHIFNEKISLGNWEKNFTKIWNDDGDELFIWDKEGLIIYYSY
jgi:endonuclease YncB( thermonuclease family)